jgi:hypothetical protein
VVRPIPLLLAAVLAAAVAAPLAQAEKLTISVTSVSVSSKMTDRPPKGSSKGDTIRSSDRLVNATPQFGKAKGAVVGSDHGTMTFTSAHSATFSGVAILPGGTLVLSGKVIALTGQSLAIPVTGGTGRYAQAKGFLVVGPGEKQALNTYALTLPGTPVA